jgi:POT family proton-dependent oligopeptide transporter
LIQYQLGAKYLGTAGLEPVPAASPEAAAALAGRARLVGGLAVVALLAFGVLAYRGVIPVSQVADAAGYMLLLITVAFFGWLFVGGDWTPAERKRLYVIGLFFLAAAIFWSLFEQAGSTLNLFGDRDTRTSIFGWSFRAAGFNYELVFRVDTGPRVRVDLDQHGKPNLHAGQVLVRLLSVGAGFAVLVIASQISPGGVQVSPLWLTAVYLLHTVGELCLSPVGLSAMTKLAPARICGLMMGVWFLATSVGNFIAGRLAGFYEQMPLPTLFTTITLFGIVPGLLLLLPLSPPSSG